MKGIARKKKPAPVIARGPVVLDGDKNAGDVLLRYWAAFLAEAAPKLTTRFRADVERMHVGMAAEIAHHPTSWLFNEVGLPPRPMWLRETCGAVGPIVSVFGFNDVGKFLKARGHL